MRWHWIDRFIEFESGRRPVAVKNVNLAEEPTQDNFPGHPVYPGTLVIEGLAQAGGLLVGEVNDFQERVVLAKVSKAVFHRYPVPGDTLRLTATIQDIKGDGAIVVGTSHIGDDLQAEVDLVFAHLSDSTTTKEQFHPVDFLVMLRLFGLYDVGRAQDGSPLVPPAHLLEAERAAAAADPA